MRLRTIGIAVLLLALVPELAPAQSRAVGSGERIRRDGKGVMSLESLAEGYGVSVAISGTEAFVGESRNTLQTGNVSVLLRAGDGSWSKVATLTATGNAFGNRFGEILDTDGERLIVGAPLANNGRGLAYVFKRQSAGVWTHEGTLSPPVPTPGAYFALTSVSIDGTTAVVGEPLSEGRAHGAAHVYEYEAGSWGLDSTLPFILTGDYHGYSVSVSGDVAAISAPRCCAQQGITYIYERSGGAWSIVQSLKLNPIKNSDWFGFRVELDGRKLAIGHRSLNGIRPYGYQVYDYDSGSSTWVDQDSVRGHGFVIDLDSSTVISGYNQVNHAYVTSGDTLAGSWAAEDSLVGMTLASGDNFGYDVGVSGDYAIVGAPKNLSGAGDAYIFERNPDSTWAQVMKFTGEGEVPISIEGGELTCSGGFAGSFECNNVDLLSFITKTDLDASAMNDVWGWVDTTHSREYALVGHRNGTAFVDVTDPVNPLFVGTLPLHAGSSPSTWRDIKTYGSHAFIVADGAGPAGMQVFNLEELSAAQGLSASAKESSPSVTLPTTFSETAHYDAIGSAHNIAINESSATAFIVGSGLCGGGVHTVDISNPTVPDSTGCYADATTGLSGSGYTHDIQCVDYVGPHTTYFGREICFGSNENAILITDVTDNAAVVTVGKGQYPDSRYVHQGWLSEDHRFFFQNDELDEIRGVTSNSRTLIWDVQDLTDPILIHEYLSPNGAVDHNHYVKGDLLYAAQYSAGLRIIDMSGITGAATSKSSVVQPSEVGYFDTRPGGDPTNFSGAWSVYPYFDSGTILVNSIGEGLFVLRSTVESIEVDVQVILEGPYDATDDSMDTTPSFQSVVPLGNPYGSSEFESSPLEHDVADTVLVLPDNTIDWVQVELRSDSTADTKTAIRSAILLTDGQVVDPNGNPLRFTGIDRGSYYIVVRHRNHFAVMTPDAIDFSSGSGSWDFRTSGGQAYGVGAQKEVKTGVWAMIAGESDLDGESTIGDFADWLVAATAAENGYLLTDFDMNGEVEINDYALWLVNGKAARQSNVPE